MTYPAQHTTDRKDLAPRITPLALIYLPVLFVLAGVVRFAVRASIIRFEPIATEPQQVLGLFNNRYFRRAQACCIRREFSRMKMTGKPITGLTYFPRRYAFMGYEQLSLSAGTFQQYLNQCLNRFGLSRVTAFGLSGANYIVAVMKTVLNGLALSMTVLMTVLMALLGGSALSLAAPADPAPP